VRRAADEARVAVQGLQEENTKLQQQQHDLHAVQTPLDEKAARVLQRLEDGQHSNGQGNGHVNCTVSFR